MSHNAKKRKNGPFGIFQHSGRKTSIKLKGDPLTEKQSKKSPKMSKKLEEWTLWNFLTSILSQNIKKIEEGRDPLVGKFFKKVPQFRKKIKGGPYRLAWFCILK